MDGGAPEGGDVDGGPAADAGVATPGGGGTSAYKLLTTRPQTGTTPIVFTFDGTLPAKNSSVVEPTTGATVRRLTDASIDTPNGGHLAHYYSRYSAENFTGEYVFVGTAGKGTRIVRRSDATSTLAPIDGGKDMYDFHEPRWHMTAAHPYRLYYRDGTKFWMIDDVRDAARTTKLIKDFEGIIDWGTQATSQKWLYNDQEGNSSHDSDHWAWMAAYYINNTFAVRAYVHYQVSTDTVHLLYPKDLAGMARAPAGESARETFSYRPNMVEMTPDGSGVLLHNSRAYPGNNDRYIGTNFEAPYVWPVDFKPSTYAPFRVGADATHSGWAKVGGAWGLVQQDNRRDFLTWVPISGPRKGYGAEGQLNPTSANVNAAGIVDFYQANDYANDSPGFHFGATGDALDGWTMVSTYGNTSSTIKGSSNALLIVQIKPYTQAPTVWHVAPCFNIWPTNNKQDFNECPAAMSMDGTRIHFPADWEGRLNHVEEFEVALPTDWRAHMPR